MSSQLRIASAGQIVKFLHEFLPSLPDGDYAVDLLGGELMKTSLGWDMGLAVMAVELNPNTSLFETIPVKAAGIDK